MAEHGFGHLKIRDDTVLEGPNGHDVAGSSPKHSFRLVADSEHLVRALLNRNYRGFAQDDAMIFDIDEGIRSPQIDPYVVREKA